MALYGCGNSCIVAYCFVAQETKVSLVNFLQIFKKYNPRWGDIKVTLRDKDMTEIVSINDELPHTVNLLCHFHMLKYICTKISSYSCSQDQKEELMKLTKKAVYSHSAQELNETMKCLEDLSPQFHEYMSKNWLSCKQS